MHAQSRFDGYGWENHEKWTSRRQTRREVAVMRACIPSVDRAHWSFVLLTCMAVWRSLPGDSDRGLSDIDIGRRLHAPECGVLPPLLVYNTWHKGGTVIASSVFDTLSRTCPREKLTIHLDSQLSSSGLCAVPSAAENHILGAGLVHLNSASYFKLHVPSACIASLPATQASFIHFIRSPFAMVASFFLFHLSGQECEYADMRHVCRALGRGRQMMQQRNTSTITPALAHALHLVVEELLVSPLPQMVDLHVATRTSRHVFTLRLESLEANFDGTIRQLLLFMNVLPSSELHRRLSRELQQHDVRRWTDAQRQQSHHIQPGRHVGVTREAVIAALMEDQRQRTQLSNLSARLGYHSVRRHLHASPASSSGRLLGELALPATSTASSIRSASLPAVDTVTTAAAARVEKQLKASKQLTSLEEQLKETIGANKYNKSLREQLKELKDGTINADALQALASQVEPLETSVIDSWLKRAKKGFCGHTKVGSLHECRTSDRGSIGLSMQAARSLRSAVRVCLNACAKCERCNYITVNPEVRDCSWYATCDMDHLLTEYHGFLSGPVVTARGPASLAASPAVVPEPQEVILCMHMEKTAGTTVRSWFAQHGWQQTNYCSRFSEVQGQLVELLRAHYKRIFVEHHCGLDW